MHVQHLVDCSREGPRPQEAFQTSKPYHHKLNAVLYSPRKLSQASNSRETSVPLYGINNGLEPVWYPAGRECLQVRAFLRISIAISRNKVSPLPNILWRILIRYRTSTSNPTSLNGCSGVAFHNSSSRSLSLLSARMPLANLSSVRILSVSICSP
jgi:hypothetical protein